MSTTDIYVESVLVGFLVLVMLGLPFHDELLCSARAMQVPKESVGSWIVGGAAAVGVAYLVGIMADRVIDSGLAVLEKHARVRYAADRFARAERKRAESAKAEGPEYMRDHYPEGDYRIRVFLDGQDPANEFLQYIRTRVRLLRATLFTLPGLTYGAAVVAVTLPVQCTRTGPLEFATIVDRGIGLLIGYGSMFVLAVAFESISCAGPSGRWAPPRTDDENKMNQYLKRRWFFPALELKGSDLWLDVAIQPFPMGAALLLGWTFLTTWPGPSVLADNWVPVSVTLLGTILTLMVGWAWWRTTFTYMTYVWQFGKALEKSPAERKSTGGPSPEASGNPES